MLSDHFDLERPERAAVLNTAKAEFKSLGVLSLNTTFALSDAGFDVDAVLDDLHEEHGS